MRTLATSGLLVAMSAGLIACGDTLPDDVQGYETRCLLMTPTPLPPREDDPHDGHKNVYACGVPLAFLQAGTRPFPEGALIVKASTRPGQSFPWLVATARRRQDGWRWDEYTRNFDNEPLQRLLVPQSTCSGCHEQARGVDWIFTTWGPR